MRGFKLTGISSGEASPVKAGWGDWPFEPASRPSHLRAFSASAEMGAPAKQQG